MSISISAIVPFHNEELTLEESVRKLITNNIFNNIVLVDDYSKDRSSEIALKITNEYNFVEYIRLDKNYGKGHAVKKGVSNIKSSHIVVHDADLEYDPVDISEMFEVAKSSPTSLILGSRTIGSKTRRNKYKKTYYGNKILTYLFSLLNFHKVSDIASCYWIIETELIKKFDLKEKGFGIEVEVLSKFLKLNREIIEIPISYFGRSYEEGKKIMLSDGLNIAYKIVKYSKFLGIFNILNIFKQQN